MRGRTFVTGLALLVLMCSAATAQDFLVRESFNYPAGASMDTLLGTATDGWAGSWDLFDGNAGTMTVADSNINYNYLAYPVPNAGLQITGGNPIAWGSQRYGRYLAQRWPDEAGKDYWLSFLIELGNGFTDNGWAGVGLFDSTAERQLFGHEWGNPNYSLAVYNEEGRSSYSWSNGPQWLVVRLMMTGDSTAERAFLWVSPEPIAGEPDTSVADARGNIGSLNSGFNRIAVHFGGEGVGMRMSVDEIRLGTSWEDVSSPLQAQNSITIINPSFELPGTAKVKGWDGFCSDPAWTGLSYDIEGWTSDEPAFDSGVEQPGADTVSGSWVGFFMAQDSAIYQITDHVIQAGDEIELRVWAWHVWSDGTSDVFQRELFYVDDNQNRVTIVSASEELVAKFYAQREDYSLSFKASDYPAAVGHKVGILFDNRSDNGRTWLRLDDVRLFEGPATGVAERPKNPIEFSLLQNYPNPFNPTTNISYTLQGTEKVRLTVYDLIGREVAVLVDEVQSPGAHFVTFSTTELATGVYFYNLQTVKGNLTKKMTLIK